MGFERDSREALDADLKAKFLEAYGPCWTVKRTLKKIGATRGMYDRWRNQDAEFKKAAKEMREDIFDEIEYVLLAQSGVFHVDNPQEYGRYKNASTAAAIFLLRGSDRYRGVADVNASISLQVNGVEAGKLSALVQPEAEQPLAIDTTAEGSA